MNAKGKVLLVEDNAELNTNNVRALRMLDYDVHPTRTLAEARLWLAENEPDIMLPDGDGLEFCAEIRGAPLRTTAHILFLTARTEHAERIRGLAAGGDDYITKPFHPEELLARIEAAMRRRNMNHPGTETQNTGTQSSSRAANKKLHAFASQHHLTEKEREILALVLRKQSIQQMAAHMRITGKGVEYHITHLLQKTGIRRRHHVMQAYADWKLSFLQKK